jgi:predicted GIY-YIG superfamily endonuclease
MSNTGHVMRQSVPILKHDTRKEETVDREGIEKSSPDKNRLIMSTLFQEFMEALNSENDFKKWLHHVKGQMK